MMTVVPDGLWLQGAGGDHEGEVPMMPPSLSEDL
jgi:hypothetical protein